ncbi:MAG TPA: insulinase family protein [Gemmatimonadaceae bacterium]|nr:insulinase family protein [Gemmatimonadaceae bacterium]
MLRPALLLAALATSLHAQSPDLGASLPTDSAVIRGRLPNGLRYLIRRNGKPEKRAELRLVVNAGSILETDAQRGLAHFVEHMAFNGTARFPKAAIVNYLERVGMRFGADLNAYTSFDETVYELQIPTDTAQLVATALDILEDWAHGVSFDTAEIRKERGVVVEEWRTGRDASTRVSYRQFPVMLKGSKYAERLPIGTKENLERFPDSLAVRFYRDWYRPDLMTVVAVGDFDVTAIEAGIRERFARIPVPASPRPRDYAAVPDHAETLVSIESDREYPSSEVTLLWLRPRDSTRTVGDFRRRLVSSFYDGMVNARFGEMAQRPDAPFAYAGGARGGFVRTKDAYQLFAAVKESGFEQAAEALLAEAERIARFGFTQTELDRSRTNLLRSLEQQYAEREKSNSAGFAAAYVSSALSGAPILGIEQRQALTKALAPGITLAEVNALARSNFTEENRVVLVAAPEKPEVKLPEARAMLAVFDKARRATLTAYVDSTSDAPLVPSPPAPGRVVRERALPETGILEWTLSNGARILLKPTDFKADEVLFSAQSPGGSSLVNDADLISAEHASTVLRLGGLGPFNAITLTKKLVGKRAYVSAFLGDTRELLSGSASSKDLETLFQLTWLRFTAPRVDSSAFVAYRSQIRAFFANQRNEPESVFGDTITVTMAQHHPRVRLSSPEQLDSVDLRRSLAIFRERFANAGDFTFFLVGAFTPDSVRPLVERYLASLPATGDREKARDEGIRPPTGVVTRTVRRGIEPKASTRLVFTGPCEYSWESRETLSALAGLLDIRLREVLREDKGGTYGVGVSQSCNSIPYARYTVGISFGSAPDRVDELVGAVFAVIDSIKGGAVSDSNLTKIREIQLREHETALKQNGAWIGNMADADEDGRDQRDFLRLPDLVKRLSREQLRDAARRYLRTDNYARFTLLPEEGAKPAPIRP